MSNPRYTISILTYCAVDHAKRCVESVMKHSSDFELILTANGNPEAEAYFRSVESQCENVRVVVNQENLGFQEPNRRAIGEARGEFYVMLNDDCIVGPGWLQALEEPFKKWPQTAAASGPEHNRSAARPDLTGYRSPSIFEYIEFSCVMLRTEIMRKIGLFSPDLQHSYGEDLDTCLRLRRLGYTLHLVPIHVRHFGSATSRHVKGIREYEKRNHEVMRKRFSHYLRVRTFDYPIYIRRIAAIGDVLLTTPIIKQIKQENPLSPIYVETGCPEVLQGNPYVVKADRVIQRDPKGLVINLDMAYENRPNTHVIDAYAKVSGLKDVEHKIEFYGADYESVKLKTDERLCAIHAGPTTWVGKNWPLERWRELVGELNILGWNVVTIGSSPVAIGQSFSAHGINIRSTAGLLSKCDLFIGLDSFPMHLAQAMGTPTVGLFGVTSPQYLMTESSPHIGVMGDASIAETGSRHRTAGQTFIPSKGESMNSISVERVLQTINHLTCQPTLVA